MLELDIMSKRGGGSMVEEKEETVERGRWCLAAPCLRLGFFFFGEQAGEIYSSSAKQASHMF